MSKKNDLAPLIILGALGFLIFNKKAIIEKGAQVVEKVLSTERGFFIDQLNPGSKDKFKYLIQEIEKKGFSVIITSGYRTFKKQSELYNENNKNARPGASLHNYGLAIDINMIKGGKYFKKNTPIQDWESTGVPTLARNLGFVWGGTFKGYADTVHFALPYNVNELKTLAVNKFGTNPDLIKGNEVNIKNLLTRV